MKVLSGYIKGNSIQLDKPAGVELEHEYHIMISIGQEPGMKIKGTVCVCIFL